MKTIKQIADELGVSKQTVRDRIAKLGLQSTLQKNGNTLVVNEQQEMLIKQDFNDETQSKSQSTLQSESQSDVRLALRLLEQQNEQLSKELDIKNEQIREQNAALEKEREHSRNLSDKLAVLTDNAQKLHLGTMHNNKQLTGFSLEQDDAEPTKNKETQNPSFRDKLKQLFKK